MKRFSFRLERLLQLRERAERTQAAELGAAMRAEETQRAALERAREALERAVERGATEPFTVGTMRTRELAREAISQRIEVEQEALDLATGKRAEEQLLWQDKRRDRRSVEKLKEKRFDAWREDASRDEQKTIDGLAQNRRPDEEAAA